LLTPPPTTYPIRNMPISKQIVEIFDSVEQKPLSLHTQLSQHQEKPSQQPIRYGTFRIQKTCIFRNLPTKISCPFPGFNCRMPNAQCPPTTSH
jgi:hypothetical protein